MQKCMRMMNEMEWRAGLYVSMNRMHSDFFVVMAVALFFVSFDVLCACDFSVGGKAGCNQSLTAKLRGMARLVCIRCHEECSRY